MPDPFSSAAPSEPSAPSAPSTPAAAPAPAAAPVTSSTDGVTTSAPDGDLSSTAGGSEPPKSLDDTLRERYSELQAEDGGEDGGDPQRGAEARLRGPDGKFLPRTAATGQRSPEEGQGEGAQPGEEQFDINRPPSSLRPAAKAAWDTLPPEIKAEFHKREGDLHKGIEQYRSRAQVGEVLAREILPFENAIRASGADVPTALRSLLTAGAVLQLGTPSQKANTLREVAQVFGVDLGQLLPSQNSEGQFRDPQVEELRNRLAMAEQREAARAAAEQASAQSAQQFQVQQVGTLIQQFASNPAHKYFSDVRDVMGQLIWSGKAPDLATAYDMACHADPSVRAAIQAETRNRENKARAEEAAKARRLGNQGARATPTPGTRVQAGQSLDDTLRAAYRDIQSR